MGLLALERPAFSGHETFPFRYTWLKKALDGVEQDPWLFLQEDALVRLGVGKNMVKSMLHWGLSCGVLEQQQGEGRKPGQVVPTELGKSLLADDGWDPYLEDPATLWMLHWRIASVPDNCSTWFFVFNELGDTRFTRVGLVEHLLAVARQRGWKKVSDASLKRDVDTFMRSYVPANTGRRGRSVEDFLDCPLFELKLIRDVGNSTYELVREARPTLPDEIFAHALAEYIQRNKANANTVSMEEIQFAEGSPGRVFMLDSQSIFERAERLGSLSNRGWSFDDTAGLSQVLIHRRVQPETFLRAYYSA